MNNRISVKFSDLNLYDDLKHSKNFNSLDKRLSDCRVYWNYNQINIYELEGVTTQLNSDGMKKKIKWVLNIVNVIQNVILSELSKSKRTI